VYVTAVNPVFESPAIGQFWSPFTDAGRAAPDAAITRQAQIIAYIDDFKLLMIATLVLIPLLIVFKRPTSGATTRVGCWPECGWNLRGAISSHVGLSDCRFAFKRLPDRELEPRKPASEFFERHGVYCPGDRPCRASFGSQQDDPRATSRCSFVGSRSRASGVARSSGVSRTL
jgi:hypothetical protein